LAPDELLAVVEEALGGGITITFSGKANAARIARKVRPRVTRRVKALSVGGAEAQAASLLLEGDNLQAMATLYRERGQVDLVLTDPPYNTGNDWRYNDRWEDDPNDTGIGELVSPEDGARHTKWMRFMWPRLQMMRAMLKPGGVLAICIDHRELFRLGQMLDELFGEANRLAIINWQKATALKNSQTHVSSSTEYVLVYARDETRATSRSLERSDAQRSRYSNPDSDPRGDWREGMLAARDFAAKDFYAIQSPFTGVIENYPPGNSHWRHPKRDIMAWLAEWGTPYVEDDIGDGYAKALVLRGGFTAAGRKRAEDRLRTGPWPFIWFGRQGTGIPRKKIYLAEIRAGRVPETYWSNDDLVSDGFGPDVLGSTAWDYQESGRSSDGAAELTAIVGKDHRFETVKPLRLFAKLISIWCPPEGLVVDPFAGSGTTGHAVAALNASTEAERRFILIEQGRPERGDPYASSLTANRLRRVLTGEWASGRQDPMPGGFSFHRLGKRVDAQVLLQMERDEMVDTVIASHFDGNPKRASNLIRVNGQEWRYLVAKSGDEEGFFLVWDGPDRNTDFTAAVYEACADEAEAAGLKPRYHIYARLYLYQTDNVRFYQIPDRILADFGLDLSSEPFSDPTQ
jgi:adenine-specific DNA-methyltransferase